MWCSPPRWEPERAKHAGSINTLRLHSHETLLPNFGFSFSGSQNSFLDLSFCLISARGWHQSAQLQSCIQWKLQHSIRTSTNQYVLQDTCLAGCGSSTSWVTFKSKGLLPNTASCPETMPSTASRAQVVFRVHAPCQACMQRGMLCCSSHAVLAERHSARCCFFLVTIPKLSTVVPPIQCKQEPCVSGLRVRRQDLVERQANSGHARSDRAERQ